jgi:hypothetical protein
MEINARTATAADFDTAAQKHANAAWLYAIAAGITYYFLEGWALIPGILSVWCVISSFSATKQASALRSGTYVIPNPNNGAPDGDFHYYDK